MTTRERSIRRPRLASVALVAIGLAVGFGWGALAYRQQMFPYTLIRDAVRALSAPEEPDARQDALESEVEKRREFAVGDLGSSAKVIDTVLLPLGVNAIDLTDVQGFGTSELRRGGLCSVDHKIVVSDIDANFLIVDLEKGAVDSLGRVTLPLGPDRSQSARLFKVHDVECSAAGRDPLVLVSYEVVDPTSEVYETQVSRIDLGDLTARRFDDWKIVFASGPGRPHWAGRLVFLDDHRFAISISSETDHRTSDDRHQDLRDGEELPEAQDPDLVEGKILAVDLDTGERTVLSLGHRNTQGLTRDHLGRLLSTENGPYGGDELNLIEEGGNYGWPLVTHGVDYGSYRWFHGEPGRHEGFLKPVFSWNPSIGISNLIEVEDFADPWNHDFLIASLKANSLFRVRLDGRALEFAEQIWLGERIRDLTMTGDGRIALFTDSGQLIFLDVAEALLAMPRTTQFEMNAPILDPCMKCHHFGPTNPTHMAPTLSQLIGRPVGADDFRYTPAIGSLTGTWTRERLREFLANPAAFAPGTTMAYAVTDDRELDELLDQLERINDVGALF